jgi:hypothetical protein
VLGDKIEFLRHIFPRSTALGNSPSPAAVPYKRRLLASIKKLTRLKWIQLRECTKHTNTAITNKNQIRLGGLSAI